MRELVVTRQFEKDFRILPPDVQIRADGISVHLRNKPTDTTLPLKKLHGFSRPFLWRVRIGDYRLIYSFDKTTITLHRISHRKDIYRKLS